jgi:hypothetical protein
LATIARVGWITANGEMLFVDPSEGFGVLFAFAAPRLTEAVRSRLADLL